MQYKNNFSFDRYTTRKDISVNYQNLFKDYTDVSQTSKILNSVVDVSKYSDNSPRRIVIKGKIIHDSSQY